MSVVSEQPSLFLATAHAADDQADAAYLRRTDRPQRASTSTIDIVDLFSGCGGLTLGALEGAARSDREARLALAVDNNEVALDVLRSALGEDESRFVVADLEETMGGFYEPVRDSERELLGRAAGATLLLAGPPCQGHSSLNNRTRHDDPRNELYSAVARAARIVRPRAVITENVRGVRSDRRGAMATCAAALEELGYAVSSRAVQLGQIGVPQTRARHVLVAAQDGAFEWDLPNVAVRPVKWAIADLLGVEAKTTFDTPSFASKKNRKRIEWLFKNDAENLPNELRPFCHYSEHSYRSMYGRLRWDAPAQTITTGFGSMGQGRYVHPLEPRTITPHEAARLQFLPDFVPFEDVRHRSDLATMIGNVAPPRLTIVLVAAMIAQGLL